MNRITLLLLIIALSSSTQILANGFDFGDLTQDGSGSFNQPIKEKAVKRVPGVIPKGIKNLKINLKSSRDVDVRLYDVDNDKAIVGWNIGALIGDSASYSSVKYNGITIKYSGFNGNCPSFSGDYGVCGSGKSPGNEYIHITGITKNRFKMTAYGYNSGTAKIDYSWKGVASDVSTRKNGSFTATLAKKKRSYLGVIPAGIDNPVVFLKATDDLDIELYDEKTNEFVVGWKSKHIDNSGKVTGNYKNDKITWSGWNGRYAETSNDTKSGINISSEQGREYIRIHGKSKNSYKMYVFAYQAGSAQVEYSWGINPIYAGMLGMGPDYLKSESNSNPFIYSATNGLMSQFMKDLAWFKNRPF